MRNIDDKHILYETIVGSMAYGTNTENSDIDKKGFFWIDPCEYLSMSPPVTPQDGQISMDNNNVVYYSLYRALQLLKDANPNFIELLWMPDDCVTIKNNDILSRLFEERNIFITKQAYHSHAKYAYAQIKKAKGKNKKVNNPKPEKMPVKEDFCYIIPFDKDIFNSPNKMPCRPIPIKDITFLDGRKVLNPDIRPTKENGYGLAFHSEIDLSQFHVSSVEHSHNVYRLYYYGKEAKGVFRGDDMLVCESISKDDEQKCVGLLIYNKDEYNKELKDWHSYWSWMKYRNEHRWVDQEKGLLNYDAKNMSHCIRLLMESEHILTLGHPVVRFEGEQLEYLMKIKNGELEYEEIMEDASNREKRLKDLFDKSKLPEFVDFDKMQNLYDRIMKAGEKYYG